MKEEIRLIPIDQISILNPRFRDQKKFAVIVQSIKNLGLKKPIQVSFRGKQEGQGPGFDLVCGQGRIEAFKALGYTEIPAIVVDISKEERLLRSLIENLARRFPTPADLLEEITRLKTRGFSNTQIEQKLDLSHSMVSGLLKLRRAGEERLLHATVTGRIPISMAIDIATAEGPKAQRALLKVYEEKRLNWNQIRTVKRLLAHRRFLGKKFAPNNKRKELTSAESIVKAYRKEGDRLKRMIKKAKICNAKLTFVVTAFSKLLSDEEYKGLLQTESLGDMPKLLWSRVTANQKEAV